MCSMLLGMTRGDLVLVLFVFAFVWVAGRVPRFGERVGAWLGAKRKG
jgi:Sec-independent protein translocase protein TatA